MTSRRRNLALGLLWLALAFLRLDRAGAAPAVARLNPSAGQVGHVVTLQGSDLAGNDLEVWFGAARALDVSNPGGTNRVIRVLVPNKVDPRDPDTVAVTVTVDGVEATAPAAPLYFTYSLPEPSPEITDFMTDDPSHPRMVLQGQSFVLTLSGSNFFLARRVPQRCIALGGERAESDVLMSSSSDTSVSCSFPGLQVTGDYEFLIAFSDASGASIQAPNFVVGERPIFGFPPIIQTISFQTNPQQAVECDYTQIVEAYVCSQGFPGARAEPGVFLGGTFTHVRFEARVTDPDSTPTQSNVLLVAASFINPDLGNEISLVLFDDGAASIFHAPQKADVPEDCTVDPSGTCVCGSKLYPVTTGDAVPRDEVFSRDLAFVDRSTVSLGLLQDCVMQQNRDAPGDFLARSALEFHIDAVDRQGNLTTWPLPLTAMVGPGAFSCTGDECGCCILTSLNRAVDCRGKPGMPSIDFPSGICLSLF